MNCYFPPSSPLLIVATFRLGHQYLTEEKFVSRPAALGWWTQWAVKEQGKNRILIRGRLVNGTSTYHRVQWKFTWKDARRNWSEGVRLGLVEDAYMHYAGAAAGHRWATARRRR